MSFSSTSLYNIKEISFLHRDWQEVVNAVTRRTKSGSIKVLKIYEVRWMKKPFPWKFTDFKSKSRFFYHGSSDSNIQGVLNQGFYPSTDGKLGSGVYSTYHTDLGKGFSRGGHIISVKVYAPKTYLVNKGVIIPKSDIAKIRQKYDAIEVRSGGGVGLTFSRHEICTFNPIRVIPRFIIKVK